MRSSTALGPLLAIPPQLHFDQGSDTELEEEEVQLLLCSMVQSYLYHGDMAFRIPFDYSRRKPRKGPRLALVQVVYSLWGFRSNLFSLLPYSFL